MMRIVQDMNNLDVVKSHSEPTFWCVGDVCCTSCTAKKVIPNSFRNLTNIKSLKQVQGVNNVYPYLHNHDKQVVPLKRETDSYKTNVVCLLPPDKYMKSFSLPFDHDNPVVLPQRETCSYKTNVVNLPLSPDKTVVKRRCIW